MHTYGFDTKSSKFIDSYLPEKKQRVKLNLGFSEQSETHFGVFWWNRNWFCKLCRRHSTLHFQSPNEKSNRDTKKNASKLFQCHSLINNSEKTIITIRSEKILSSSSQKLLGIHTVSIEDHAKILCRKASQKLNALSRVAHYMNLSQR